MTPRDFAAVLSQVPVGLSYQLGLSSCGEKRQAACRDPAAVTLQVRRVEVSKKWKMKIHCLLKTCQGCHTWPCIKAAIGVKPVAAD